MKRIKHGDDSDRLNDERQGKNVLKLLNEATQRYLEARERRDHAEGVLVEHRNKVKDLLNSLAAEVDL